MTGNFSCRHCNRVLTTQGNIRRHILRIHERQNLIKRPKCVFCNVAKFTPSELYQHLSIIHTKEKPYFCCICSEEFSNKRNRNCHEKTHDSNRKKQFQCELCRKQFHRMHALQYHIRLHTLEKAEVCKICGESFQQSHQLKHHIQLRHENTRHSCLECPKSFTTASNLRQHVKAVHRRERRFQCKKCTKSFYYSTVLKRHLRVHTGERS